MSGATDIAPIDLLHTRVIAVLGDDVAQSQREELCAAFIDAFTALANKHGSPRIAAEKMMEIAGTVIGKDLEDLWRSNRIGIETVCFVTDDCFPDDYTLVPVVWKGRGMSPESMSKTLLATYRSVPDAMASKTINGALWVNGYT